MDSIILKKEYRRTIHETDGAFLESDHDGAYTIHSWALDPTEDDLIKAFNTFSQEYSALLSKSRMTNDAVMLRQESLKETMKFRDFKTAGVQGIENCRIRSIILPLLADHVLREVNHYIRLLSDRQ